MSKNELNVRVQHKHDIEANWNKAENFIPRDGEIIVYKADENNAAARIKVGDGETSVTNLPFSGKAGLEIVFDGQTPNFEEGVFLVDADKLGGISAEHYARKDQVVTSVNGMTGDVVITEGGGSIDTSNFYSTSNPPPYPVTSVNGQTVDVVIPEIKYADVTFNFSGEDALSYSSLPSGLTDVKRIINIYTYEENLIVGSPRIYGSNLYIRAYDPGTVVEDFWSGTGLDIRTGSFNARIYYF